MADPTPTREQALTAVMSVLQGGALTATLLHVENRYKSEVEALREYQKTDGSYETEVLFVGADVQSVEGKTFGEKYSIYKFELRHLYTRQDDLEISRIAKFRAEKIRGLIEGNAAIFRIGSQVPLRTEETCELRGGFVDNDGSRYYESKLTFSVEARRWA